MTPQLVTIFAGIALLIGIGVGYLLRWLLTIGKRNSLEIDIKKRILDAKEDAKKITTAAEEVAKKIKEKAEEEKRKKEEEYKETEKRLIKKEEFLDNRQLDIDREFEKAKERIEEIKQIRTEADELKERRQAELEKITTLSEDDAKKELLSEVERKHNEDLMIRMQKLEMSGKQKLEKRAQEILTTSIHRLGNSVASDVMATSVSIPSDDIKGKIIGKEGRNIKAFEKATGVEVVIDDTPGTVVLSSFDPIRRQVARLALENLILDGRIQPARIEETVEKAREEINQVIREKGEQAAYECGVFNLDPRVISILGRLYFRTSYGQNVLQHSMEVSHIAGMLAQELGANVLVAKAGGLLHDIGKAVDHEIPGTHVEIGIRILQKFGVQQDTIDAMKSHHEEYPYETLESYIVQTADAISGARPGARRDTVEGYLKRLGELEALASRIEGVDKSYAIQAGREIRVFVNPDNVSDIEAKKIAQRIASDIESELTYPGEIKIHVIREKRIVEYAR